MPHPFTITARWIFPGDQPPLPGGTITLAGDRILAVEPHGRTTPDRDLGDVAVLPGLVNAHTHLDLSDALGKCPPTPEDFTKWLRLVIAHRRSQTPEDVQRAISTGLSQLLASGTTLVGDISSGGASWDVLEKAYLRSVVFYEQLGLSAERLRQVLREFRSWRHQRNNNAICRKGYSPHAPYSVNKTPLCMELSQGRSYPVTIHLAECAAELQLLAHRSGPMEVFLKELGAWDEAGMVDSLATVLHSRRKGYFCLFIHGNYLPPDTDLGLATLVYCPRTHAAFQHPPHPFREFLKRGQKVALGTDSLASNPDLDILAEARFVHRLHPDLPGDILLRMITQTPADALNWGHETGSITPGKSADFCLLECPPSQPADPYEHIFASYRPALATIFRGSLVFKRDPGLVWDFEEE